MTLFGKKKEKKEDVYRGLVCPFCFAKFDGDQVHFRRREEIGAKEDYQDKELNAYSGKTIGRREVYRPFENGQNDKVHFEEEMVGKLVRRWPTRFEQPNGSYTRDILCPYCHNTLNETTLRGKSKALSILGYTQIGKTHYMISLLQHLEERAHSEADGDLSVTWLYGRDKYEKLLKQYLHNELGATNRGENPEPMVLRLAWQGREVTLSFFDFPGESYLRDISGLKYFENADAYMVLFDLTKTETFRYLSIEQQKKDVAEQIERLGSYRDCHGRILKRMEKQFAAYLSDTGYETEDHVIKRQEWRNILTDTAQTDAAREVLEYLFARLYLGKQRNILTDTAQTDAAKKVLEDLFARLYLGKQTYYYDTLLDTLLHPNVTGSSPSGAASVNLNGGLPSAAGPVGMPGNQPKEIEKEVFVDLVYQALEESGLTLCDQQLAEMEIGCLFDFLKGEIWNNARQTARNMGIRITQLAKLLAMLQANDSILRGEEGHAGGERNNGIDAKQNLGEWIKERLLKGVQDDESLKKKPMAFVGTKSDEVIRILDMLSTKACWEPYKEFSKEKITEFLQKIGLHKTALQPSKGLVQPNGNVVAFRKYYNPTIVEDMHKNLSEMLWEPGQPEHAYLKARGINPPRGGMDFEDKDKVRKFANHRMFAVSALGTYYEVNEWGETQRHAAQAAMQLANVAQPLYWLLHELGFFGD